MSRLGGYNRYNDRYDRHNGGYDNYYSRKAAPGIMAYVEDKPHRGGYERDYYNIYYNRDYNRDYYPNSMHGGALGIFRDELGIKIINNNLRDEILQIEL